MNLKVLGSNKTELETPTAIIFFSYNTPVAFNDKVNGGFFKTSKRWSVTTSKHINQWLEGANAKEVEQEVLDSLVK